MAYKSLPAGSSWRACRKLQRDMNAELYGEPYTRNLIDIHETTPITGIGLTTSYQIIPISHANLFKHILGNWTLNTGLNRLEWDGDTDMVGCFWGAAGLEVTSVLSADVVIIFALFVDGVELTHSEITVVKQASSVSMAANSSLLKADDTSSIEPNSYIDFYVKASAGTPTIDINYINILIKED